MSFLTLPNITLNKMNTLANTLLPVLGAGDVIALQGDLGAGKSTLSRALIVGACGADTVVPSPTFTLVQTYGASICDIWHMDWYRLEDPEQIWELGVEEAFSDAICLIEWAERASDYLPEGTLTIEIVDMGNDARTISFIGDAWQDRLSAIKQKLMDI